MTQYPAPTGVGTFLVQRAAATGAQVAQVFPPERAADAHRRLDTGHSGGKLVLQFRQEP